MSDLIDTNLLLELRGGRCSREQSHPLNNPLPKFLQGSHQVLHIWYNLVCLQLSHSKGIVAALNITDELCSKRLKSIPEGPGGFVQQYT
jgi:hypothetical protein